MIALAVLHWSGAIFVLYLVVGQMHSLQTTRFYDIMPCLSKPHKVIFVLIPQLLLLIRVLIIAY